MSILGFVAETRWKYCLSCTTWSIPTSSNSTTFRIFLTFPNPLKNNNAQPHPISRVDKVWKQSNFLSQSIKTRLTISRKIVESITTRATHSNKSKKQVDGSIHRYNVGAIYGQSVGFSLCANNILTQSSGVFLNILRP